MMPSLFVSHGAPTFAIEPGLAGAQLRTLGQALDKPHAIIVVSPHWMTRGVVIASSAHPSTMHDFMGFPRALYSLQYPAPGSPALAVDIEAQLDRAGIKARLDNERGLDHGAWAPLLHLYPKADIPVVQVSLPVESDALGAFALGRALAPLADEGVLIIGSGSLTHNLYEVRMNAVDAAPYAQTFSAWVREAVMHGDTERLLQTLDIAPYATRAHPTTEHFLPLLVAAGACLAPDSSTVLSGGILHGVLAMESYVFGRDIRLEVSTVM